MALSFSAPMNKFQLIELRLIVLIGAIASGIHARSVAVGLYAFAQLYLWLSIWSEIRMARSRWLSIVRPGEDL